MFNRAIVDRHKMKQKRHSLQFLSWLRTLGHSKPHVKEDMVRILNDCYRDFLSFGKITEFYEYGLHKSPDLIEFRKINHLMSTSKSKWFQRGKININVHRDFSFTAHDNNTLRDITQTESIFAFEHKMRTLQLKVCKSCREYRLQFDDSMVVANKTSDDAALNNYIPESTKTITCSECKRKGA